MYERIVSSFLPTIVFFIVDESGSVADSFPGSDVPVWEWIARFMGHIIKEMLTRSTDVQGDSIIVKPRYYIGIIFYGKSPHFWGDPLMDIQTVVDRYSQAGNSFGQGGHLGGTDTLAAFEMAYQSLEQHLRDDRFQNSFPPLVFHFTDGLSHTDASPIAEKIKSLSVQDGNALVANAFIGSQTSLNYQGPQDFPGYVMESEAGPSVNNIRLFNMSSVMPETIHQNLVNENIFPNIRNQSRLFFDIRSREMVKNCLQIAGSGGSRHDRQDR